MGSFGRKGQVTVFIIVGIILLLLIVVLIYQGNFFKTKASTYEVTEQIDEQFSAVRNFVETCLDKTANSGLDLIGQQGGYIDPASAGMTVGYPGRQRTDAFKFIEGSNIVVPYWYYLASPMDCSGDCEFDSKVPDLEGDEQTSIQSQLEGYIFDELDKCLNNFESLSVVGFNVTVNDSLDSRVLIRDNDVRFYLEYPLDASRGGTNQRISQFAIDVDVPLKTMYQYAVLLALKEVEFSYLETSMMSAVSINSGVSAELLPPISATTYDYVSTVFWIKSNVKKKLQDVIGRYTDGLRVMNSKNFKWTKYENPNVDPSIQEAVQRVYNNLVIPLNISDVNNPFNDRFDVSYSYLNWPIYFETNNEGAVIKPNSLSSGKFSIGFQQFDTYYDITYPVHVEIIDSNARKKTGYTFSFGLQSNIRENKPLYYNYTLNTDGLSSSGIIACEPATLTSGVVSLATIDSITREPISDASVIVECGANVCSVGSTDADGMWSGSMPACRSGTLIVEGARRYARFSRSISTSAGVDLNVGDVELEPKMNFAGTLLCNPEQFNSGDVSLVAVNNLTKNPLGGVSIMFACGLETCSIGSTSDDGSWSGKMPICGGASLILEKDENYVKRVASLSTNLDEDLTLGNIELEPLRNISAAVYKKWINKYEPGGRWLFEDVQVDLDPDEFAVVSYTQIDNEYGVEPVSGTFIYYGASGSTEDTQLHIVPGIYALNIQAILNKKVFIPAQKESVLLGLMSFKIPEMELDQLQSGLFTIDESKGYWTVTSDDIDTGNDALKLYIISPNILGITIEKRVTADLSIMEQLDRRAIENFESLKPVFTTASELPTLGGTPQPVISLIKILPFKVLAGDLVTYSITLDELNSDLIKDYRVTSPAEAATSQIPYDGSSFKVRMPSNAKGFVKVEIVLTLKDGSEITKNNLVFVE